MKKFLNSKLITWLLLGIYLIILTWVILAKMHWSLLEKINLSWISSPRTLLHPGVTWTDINLIPFAGTAIVNGHIDYIEPILNVIFFIPLGMFIKPLYPHSSIISGIFYTVSLSAIYEIFQYIFAIGYADITDIITNTTGGFIGICLTLLISGILKQQHFRILFNCTALICESYIIYYIYYIL